ncbi:MAG: transglycosylase domain-containing protein [Bdellovibrionales bacterium]|nr:transglycosylase domain-containing protein [Bdellovibrionales bacterium]
MTPSALERCKIFWRQWIWTRRTLRVAIYGTLALTLPWLIWVGLQYRELRSAFVNRNEFVPTRIYSDVSRIAPPLPRARVLTQLRALGYEWIPSGNDISFKLRQRDFPGSLLPADHPTLRLQGSLVHLRFDGPSASSTLISLESGGSEAEEIYLEPELVATLSRGSTGEGNQIRNYIPFDQIPSSIWKAIIAVEDQHFLDHRGLDPRGFARAVLVNLSTFSLAQGGSTLTQQLVKNLLVRRDKNLLKKFNELFLSVLLEIEFEKERILERYLNEVYLGQIGNLEIHGVAEGAEYFFGKKLDQLNMGEIALLAGIIRGPWYYSPYRNLDRAVARQRLVLDKMVETGQIAEEEAVAARVNPIRLVPPAKSSNKAPYFSDYVKAELIEKLQGRIEEAEITNAGFRVYTTLDPAMNVEAQKAVAEGVERLRKQHKLAPEFPLEGALAAVDHGTGRIRALVGGSSYQASSFNRILNMRRQVGSTFKPVVYLAAILARHDSTGVPYGPGYPVEDAPWTLTFDGGKQTWSPKNYDEEFLGWTSLRFALANSVNIAAAKLGMQVGLDRVAAAGHALGIRSELPEFPALTLGIAELSPVELLAAYATLAARGLRQELTVIRAITQNDGKPYAQFMERPHPAVDTASVDLLTEMLRETFRSGTARFAPQLGFDRPAAGKTGTTSDHRDAWFAGFTPQLTAVAWVGVDRAPGAPALTDGDAPSTPVIPENSPAPVKLTGAGSALPIWTSFMTRALEGTPPHPFPESEHLEDVRIDLHSGFPATSGCPDEQSRVEKYLNEDAFGGELGDSQCAETWPVSVSESAME